MLFVSKNSFAYKYNFQEPNTVGKRRNCKVDLFIIVEHLNPILILYLWKYMDTLEKFNVIPVIPLRYKIRTKIYVWISEKKIKDNKEKIAMSKWDWSSSNERVRERHSHVCMYY